METASSPHDFKLMLPQGASGPAVSSRSNGNKEQKAAA